jgi:hypothetical protein
MTEPSSPLTLTSDLDHWEVTLKNRDIMRVRAHTVSEEDGYLRFEALMVGEPAFLVELVRLPIASVEDYEGGWPVPQRAT